MQKIDFEHINFSIDAQFHVLLHFNAIDENYHQKMVKNGFSNEQIHQQLKEDRSKFDRDFAANPEVLWQKLAQQIELGNYQIIGNPNKKVLIFLFENQYVGEDNLYQLPEPVAHDEVYGNTVHNPIIKIHGTPIETKQVNCILSQVDEQIEVLTIFPGVYAPPFPNIEKQTEKEYSESYAFWTTHAIIKKQ